MKYILHLHLQNKEFHAKVLLDIQYFTKLPHVRETKIIERRNTWKMSILFDLLHRSVEQVNIVPFSGSLASLSHPLLCCFCNVNNN